MSRGSEGAGFETPTVGLDLPTGRHSVLFDAGGYDAGAAYLAQARASLRRAGIRVLLCCLALTLALGIVEGTAHDDRSKATWTFPEAWLPREFPALLLAGAVLLVMAFLVRFLPGGREAARMVHFFAKPQWAVSRVFRRDRRLYRASGPRSPLAVGWQVLAGVLAVGVAAVIVGVSIADYAPDVHTTAAGLTGPGLSPRVLTYGGDSINYDDVTTATRRVTDDTSGHYDIDSYDWGASLEQVRSPAAALAVVAEWMAEQQRLARYDPKQQLTAATGSAVSIDDHTVEIVQARGDVVVDLELYGGLPRLVNGTVVDTTRQQDLTAARTAVAALLNDSAHLLSARGTWWK